MKIHSFHSLTNPRLFSVAPLEALVDPELAREIRMIVRKARALEPLLTPLDSFMVSLQRVQMLMELRFVTRSAPARLPEFTGCHNRALNCVIAADAALATEAGMHFSFAVPSEAIRAHLACRIARWEKESEAVVDRARNGDPAGVTLRELFLVLFACFRSDQRIAPPHELLAAIRKASHSAARQRGEKRSKDDDVPAALGADYHLAVEDPRDLIGMINVNADGSLGLNWRQLRDKLPRHKAWQAAGSLEEPVVEEVPLGASVADKSADAQTIELEARDELAGILRAIVQFQNDRLPKAKPGTARRIVLENLPSLLLRRTSLPLLSKSSGWSVSALGEALQAERAALRLVPSLRRLAG